MDGTSYRVGVHPQTFAVAMNLNRAGFTESRAVLLARYVEFWCQKNCFSEWHVEQTSCVLRVSFATPNDMVLFMISEEYGYFVPSATVRPHLDEPISNRFVRVITPDYPL